MDSEEGKRLFFCGCLGVLLTAAALPGLARAQAVEWIRQFGSAGSDTTRGVAVDATGVYVVGETSGTLSGQTNAGGTDAFVRKYSASGNQLWTRQFGSADGDFATGVAVDAAGVFVVGYSTAPPLLSTNEAFLRKYDVSGNLLWTRQVRIPGLNTYAHGVATQPTGVYVVGHFSNNAGGFVRKYDFEGNLVWVGSGGSGAFGVAADATDVYVVGLTDQTLPGQTGAGGRDAFVRKYSASGNQLWTRQFGSALSDRAWSVSVNATGSFIAGVAQPYVGQTSPVEGESFVRKYDIDGNEQWTRQFEGLGYGGVMAADATGAYVVGATGGSGGGAFVRNYDADGNELCIRQFGSAGDFAAGVAVDAAGIYVVGGTGGTLPGQTNTGGTDAFVVKLALSSACTDSCTYSIAPTSQSFSASGGTGSVSLTAPSNCLWTASSNASWISFTSGSTGSGNGTVGYSVGSNNSALARAGTLTIAGQTFTVTQAGLTPPVPVVSGLVNGASFAPGTAVALGSIASAFGNNLAPSASGSIAVRLNGVNAPVFAYTGTQVNFQVPWELAGVTQGSLTVTVDGVTSSPVMVPLSMFAPGLFSTNSSGGGQGAILIGNTSYIAAPLAAFPGSRPAHRGEYISIYGTGLGSVTNQPPTGIRASDNPLSVTTVIPLVSIGSVPASVIFSGLAPGFSGLYQINVQVPEGAPTGVAVPVVLAIGGTTSNIVTIAVQ